MGAFLRMYMSFSKQIQSRGAVLRNSTFSPILVFQNISLGKSNACKCNDWSGLSLSSFHSLPSLCIREGVKSKSYGRVCAEPENNGIIFICLPPPCAYQSSTQKKESSMFQQPGKSKDFDKSTPLDNDTTRGF